MMRITRRWVKNARLNHAGYLWALAPNGSPGAKAHYDELTAFPRPHRARLTRWSPEVSGEPCPLGCREHMCDTVQAIAGLLSHQQTADLKPWRGANSLASTSPTLLGWDTGRAVTNLVCAPLVGPTVLTAFQRAARPSGALRSTPGG